MICIPSRSSTVRVKTGHRSTGNSIPCDSGPAKPDLRRPTTPPGLPEPTRRQLRYYRSAPNGMFQGSLPSWKPRPALWNTTRWWAFPSSWWPCWYCFYGVGSVPFFVRLHGFISSPDWFLPQRTPTVLVLLGQLRMPNPWIWVPMNTRRRWFSRAFSREIAGACREAFFFWFLYVFLKPAILTPRCAR